MEEPRLCIKCKKFALEDNEEKLFSDDGKLAYTEWQCRECGCVFLFNRNANIEFIDACMSETKPKGKQ